MPPRPSVQRTRSRSPPVAGSAAKARPRRHPPPPSDASTSRQLSAAEGILCKPRATGSHASSSAASSSGQASGQWAPGTAMWGTSHTFRNFRACSFGPRPLGCGTDKHTHGHTKCAPTQRPGFPCPDTRGALSIATQILRGRTSRVDEDMEREAATAVQRSRSPTPDAVKVGVWTCAVCFNENTKYDLQCSRAGCATPRPLREVFRHDRGDWICESCGNHNFGSARRCKWVSCHTRDWTCPRCDNLNFAARKVCNTRWCRHPRPE